MYIRVIIYFAKAYIVNCHLSSKSTLKAFSLTWQAAMQIYRNKKSVYVRKEFKSHRIGLEHHHGHHFIVLLHQYGCCDVM